MAFVHGRIFWKPHTCQGSCQSLALELVASGSVERPRLHDDFILTPVLPHLDHLKLKLPSFKKIGNLSRFHGVSSGSFCTVQFWLTLLSQFWFEKGWSCAHHLLQWVFLLPSRSSSSKSRRCSPLFCKDYATLYTCFSPKQAVSYSKTMIKLFVNYQVTLLVPTVGSI